MPGGSAAAGHTLVDDQLDHDFARAGIAAGACIGGNAHAVAGHDAARGDAGFLLQEVGDGSGTPGAEPFVSRWITVESVKPCTTIRNP